MSNKNLLDSIKKLRELTGVGFKDCKIALEDSNGDIEKSIEFLRKKGIAKASKKMNRTASEGLAIVKEVNGNISLIESEVKFESLKSKLFLLPRKLLNCLILSDSFVSLPFTFIEYIGFFFGFKRLPLTAMDTNKELSTPPDKNKPLPLSEWLISLSKLFLIKLLSLAGSNS